MKIKIDGWAWIPISDLGEVEKARLIRQLTLTQRVPAEYAKRKEPTILQCFVERDGFLGIPREFLFERAIGTEIEYAVASGAAWPQKSDVTPSDDGSVPEWAKHRTEDPFELTFFDCNNNRPAVLRGEQEQAMDIALSTLNSRPSSGGIIQCPTGWGKTIWALALVKQMRLKTAVLVHRSYLADQWRKKIEQFLPDAKVGSVLGKKWDVEDKHIVIVMIETLASWAKRGTANPELANQFGLVVTDEVHRAGAPTWASAIPLMNAAKRIGISARPKRSDGLDKAFFAHIGPKVFTGHELRLMPKIRRVRTSYKLNNPRLNPALLSKELVVKFMTKNAIFNQQIVEQIKLALTAGRKILVYSHSLDHLRRMKEELEKTWDGKPMKADYFIGGITEEGRDQAETADVIFATYQMAAAALDIPALDTVVLATPIRNPEQPVGRILRPYPGKKDPVVVDIRADDVPVCRDYAESRDRIYERLYPQPVKEQTTISVVTEK